MRWTGGIDGKSGSNFLLRPDEVGAVGPVSVDPGLQAKGLGRALMEDVLRHARDSGTGKVRLMQDAFNAVSLSLYASLGFDTCPLTDGGLYRRLLANGCRTRKVMNLMTMGPYEEPEGAWMPSVAY